VSFLTPAFLVGLGALAVPILIHLIQRERKRVIEFPSLMFVRRIPYQSVRRRRIRHWFLLLLRAAAVALIVAAFSRPFFQQQAKAYSGMQNTFQAVEKASAAIVIWPARHDQRTEAINLLRSLLNLSTNLNGYVAVPPAGMARIVS